MAQSMFAKRLLEKQGWKEGDGLGKKRDGISEPIKVNLKMDKTGVGHDPGSDFTDHWWLRVFNDAASTIPKTKESTEVAKTRLPSTKLYKGFTKGSILTNGKEEKDSNCSSDDEEEGTTDSSRLPTLDDLHKFCGGASGSRAATLGIKMNGKLHRAAEQERLFNERMMKNTSNSEESIDSPKSSKKKKKKSYVCTDNEPESVAETQTSATVTTDKQRKRKINCLKENENMNVDEETIQSEETTRKKSKKKKKHKKTREVELIDESDETTFPKTKKKSKHIDDTAIEEKHNLKKKKMKHR